MGKEIVICNTPIAILLATYNGEKYLSEQIDSLLSQTYNDFTLYVHDDGSKDNTLAILSEYSNKYTNIVVLDYEPSHGAKENFFGLLDRVEAEYYMFCDQDDIWHNDKIEKSLSFIRLIESEHKGKPVCVYSDLKVVDENGNTISESFFEMEGIHPEFLQDFDHASASNFATGCTMLFNHKAKEMMHPNIAAATMHDSWVALSVLKVGGSVVPISEALIDYRQHGNNTLGAIDSNRLTLSYRIRNAKSLLSLLWKHYKMHQALGFGSILKFIYFKFVYKYKIHNS